MKKRKKRVSLPNGCYISEPSVFPSNWQTSTASIKKKWYIHYYFYDPSLKESKQYNYVKKCVIQNNIILNRINNITK